MSKSSRRIIFFILLPMLTIILSALVISYIVFSGAPFNKEVSGDMSISSMIGLKKKINREIKHIFSNNPAAERKITFSKSELNTAFDLYIGVSQFGGLFSKEQDASDKVDLRRIKFENGMFSLYVSRRTLSFESYTIYLNIEADIVPSITSDKLTITVRKLRFGDISVPSGILNNLIKDRESQINDSGEVKKVLKCIKELNVESSSVTIVYSPRKLMEYFPDLKRLKF